MGLLGDCPGRAGGCWEGAGHEGDKVRASVGLPCHVGFREHICTICNYLQLFVFLNARIKREVQIAVRNRGRCWCLTF